VTVFEKADFTGNDVFSEKQSRMKFTRKDCHECHVSNLFIPHDRVAYLAFLKPDYEILPFLETFGFFWKSKKA